VARFRLRVLNSRQVSADLLDTAAHIGRAGDRASREIGRAGEQALRSAAPSRTGHLRRGIGTSEETRAGRQVIVVHGEARNPLTGYDYFDVTRFGQRGARIYPRLDRAPATVVATRRGRAVNTFSPIHGVRGNAALRFVIGGRVLYRRWVRAYHPSHDWVEDADPAIDSAIEAATARLARGL
jgi:hypothetical protein